MLSSKPVKFPTGLMRPVAFAAKSPGGTAAPPWVKTGTLSGGDKVLIEHRARDGMA